MIKQHNMEVIKRDGSREQFDEEKILNAILKAYHSQDVKLSSKEKSTIEKKIHKKFTHYAWFHGSISVEKIQDMVEAYLLDYAPYSVLRAYIVYRDKHKNLRDWANKKIEFINNYKQSDNTANATIDDNSNVYSKNIGIINSEIHKPDNILISRKMVMNKLKELYPDFDSKQYERDLESHIIYKHDESGFSGAIAPYCCSITMYPFLLNGIRDIGGLSAAPKNLDSFCGMYINLIFAVSAMFAGAVATSEFLLYFDYFAKKEWGDDYWQNSDKILSNKRSKRTKTVLS